MTARKRNASSAASATSARPPAALRGNATAAFKAGASADGFTEHPLTNPEPTPVDPPQGQPQPAPRPEPKPEPAKTFTQAELDAIVADRLARDRKKFADYDDLKKKAADYDGLLRDTESETEKRVREAREEGERAAREGLRPRLVLAEMRAAAAGRVEPDRFDALTEDLDLSKYLTDDGDVDMAKVRRKVDAWAPAPAAPAEDETPKGPRRPRPDPTQGSGRKAAGDVDRGLEEARRRFGDRARIPS